MSRYNANTIIEGRYLLIESISHDLKSGRQVWSAKDNQTGKRVLGRFEANGKIEWFPDTRNLASNSSKQKISTKPKIVLPAIKLSQSSSTFRRFIPLFMLFGVGLITVAYYQKDKIQDFWQVKFNSSNGEQLEEGEEDLDESNAESVSANTPLSNGSSRTEQPNQPASIPPVFSNTEDSSVIDTPIEAVPNQKVEQAVNNSNVAGTVSPIEEKHSRDAVPKRDHHAIAKPPKKKPSSKQNTFVTDSELNKN
ncbi:hypothetical protein [Spirosoma sp. KUDC1026]|uniref:hypothetical protein n=1 Tax=Spirosoma sp. KUDC1026 TaxID=2745947 RepID=UPI00159BB079|nr:hypothetical protein [Spirosoma sp. KUDC1026]QKZ13779.1 hypothetical protein HU175_14530 [Spirosoma sp. KUDC1026]